MSWTCFISIAVLLCKAQFVIGDDIKLSVQCNYTEEEALLTYKGDVYGMVAIKANGDRFWFEEDISIATYQLIVLFAEGEEPGECVFDKTAGFAIYTIKVQTRKTFKDFESMDDEEFIVECNFETFVSDIIGSVSIESPVIVPVLVHQDFGQEMDSGLTITVVKMDGTDFTGPVSLGRLVRLKATTNVSTEGVVGYKASNCYVTTDDDSKSSIILVEGCGTGSPFTQTEGLTTTGLEIISPIFRMFRIKATQGIAFTCSFVVCSESCDGSSCAAAGRKKREAISEHSSMNSQNREKRDIWSLHKDAFGPNPVQIKSSAERLKYWSDSDTENITKVQEQTSGVRVISGNILRVALLEDTDDGDQSQENTIGLVKSGNLKHTKVRKLSSNYRGNGNGTSQNVKRMRSRKPDSNTGNMTSSVISLNKSKVVSKTHGSNKVQTTNVGKVTYLGQKGDLVLQNTGNNHKLPKDPSKVSSDAIRARENVISAVPKTAVTIPVLLKENEKSKTNSYKSDPEFVKTNTDTKEEITKNIEFQVHLRRKLMDMKLNIAAFAGLATSCLVGLVAFVIVIVVIVLHGRRKKQSSVDGPDVAEVQPA